MNPDRENTNSNGYRTRALAIMLVLFMVTMVITPMISLAVGTGEPVELPAPADEVFEVVEDQPEDVLDRPEEVIETVEETIEDAPEPEDTIDRDFDDTFSGPSLCRGTPSKVPIEEPLSEFELIQNKYKQDNREFPSSVDEKPSASVVGDHGKGPGQPFSNPPGPYPDAWNAVTPLPGSLVRYAHAQDPGNPNSFYTFSGVAHGSVVPDCWRYDVPTDTWNPLTPMPTGGEGPTGTCDGTNAYVMGGNLAPDQLAIYNIAGDSWTSGAFLPRACIMAAAGTWGGQVFLIGGDNDFFAGNGVSNEVNIYEHTNPDLVRRILPDRLIRIHCGRMEQRFTRSERGRHPAL
jgi:hypothetical protein